MRVTVVDSGSTDGTPDMVAREFPEFRLERARQHRLLGRQQPGPAGEPRRRGPAAQSGHRGLRRAPSTPAWRASPPTRRSAWSGRSWCARTVSSTTPPSAPSPPRWRRSPTSPGSAVARARASRSRSTGRRTWARTSRARSTRSTAPSCSAGPRRSPRSACSTRATGSTWRTSTGATASGTRAGRSSTNRPRWRSTSRADRARGAAPRSRRSPSTAAWAASTAASTPRPRTRS